MVLTSDLFTRQKVAELTGIPDDVLAFWIKNGLLVPTSGGEGRGSHRKFNYVQVHIAAVLGEARKFGANIGKLRSFAGLLQRGYAVCWGANLHSTNAVLAAQLAQDLARFRRGEIIEVPRMYPEPHWTPAATEQEVIETRLLHIERDRPEDIVAFAQTLQEDDALPVRLLADLVNQSNLLERQPGWEEVFWLVTAEDDDRWGVIRANFGSDLMQRIADGRTRSGILVTVSLIIRQIWARSE